MNETKTDCQSEEGITVGLIDALISIARVLAMRDMNKKEVKEALKDLKDDKDIKKILEAMKEV